MTRPPPPHTELVVDVTASRFVWQFSYPEYGVKSDLLSRDSAGWIAAYSFLLVAVTLLLRSVAGLGMLYVVAASLLGLVFLGLALQLWRGKTHAAQDLYFYSIIYILLLFGAMMADRLAYFFVK